MVTSTSKKPANNEEEAIAMASIHADILEEILSHLPLIHLLPASLVSKSWNRAVSSTLRSFDRLSKPWLFLHIQSTRSPYQASIQAYDPDSELWISIQQPSIDYFSVLRSSQSNLLYMLFPSKLSFSFDPLHMTWHHAVGPSVWRMDPVVAVVGEQLVVAGGGCDFEDDPLAVEIYDLRSRIWTKSESMPEFFKDCGSSMWLSVASNERHLFVMEKQSGVMHSFDLETNMWHGPYRLCPDHRIFSSVIGFSDNRLVFIGMIGDADNVDGVKLWEVKCENFECDEIGEMPDFLVEKLNSEDELRSSSLDVSVTGKLAHIYIANRPEEVMVCEFNDGGCCSWRSLTNAAAIDRNVTERLIFTCSKVGMEELQQARRSENLRLAVAKRITSSGKRS